MNQISQKVRTNLILRLVSNMESSRNKKNTTCYAWILFHSFSYPYSCTTIAPSHWAQHLNWTSAGRSKYVQTQSERQLDVHRTYRRILNVQWTFSLGAVPSGFISWCVLKLTIFSTLCDFLLRLALLLYVCASNWCKRQHISSMRKKKQSFRCKDTWKEKQ